MQRCEVCGRTRNYEDSDEGAEKFEDLLRDAEARCRPFAA